MTIYIADKKKTKQKSSDVIMKKLEQNSSGLILQKKPLLSDEGVVIGVNYIYICQLLIVPISVFRYNSVLLFY